MKRPTIAYREGYKYQLAKDYNIKTTMIPRMAVDSGFIRLDRNGELLIRLGYAWDGPSGPVMDTPDKMRASLVHDALYQLMRQRFLPRKFKKKADRLYERLLVEDGVPKHVARAHFIGLKYGGDSSTDPANAKKVLRAPRPSRYKKTKDARR